MIAERIAKTVYADESARSMAEFKWLRQPDRGGQGSRASEDHARELHPGTSWTLSPQRVPAPAGARATYRGRPGHPVVLGPEQMAAASQLTGDRGLQLAGGPTIECGDLCYGRDIDTPEDLHEGPTSPRCESSESGDDHSPDRQGFSAPSAPFRKEAETE